MKLSAWRTHHTVRWPRVYEVRLVSKVSARIDVMITSGNHIGVTMITVEQLVYSADSGSAPGHT